MKRASSASDITLEVPQQPRSSQSHIPVITPRRSQSSLPSPATSSMSSVHLGIVPPPRHLSVSGSPSPRASTSSSAASSSTTPATSFRSFRNLLSFGPSKPTSSPSIVGIPKSPFSGFASIRRSIHSERSVSAPEARRGHSLVLEDSPVLSIDLPNPGLGPLMHELDLKASVSPDRKPSDPTHFVPAMPSVRTDAQAPFEPTLVFSDLSTILESDTSGISRHLPIPDDSVELDHSTPGFSSPYVSADTDLPSSHACFAQHSLHRSSHPRLSLSTSPLDLSTSKVTHEVMEALSETSQKEGWLNGVIVDDTTDKHTGLAKANPSQDAHDSFNLSALDPDLAALLSPNTLMGTEPALMLALGTLPTLELIPFKNEASTLLPSAQLQGESPRRPPSSPPPSSSPPLTFPQQSSPVRRPAQLPRTVPSTFPSSSLPRLTRSASDRPTPLEPSTALNNSSGRAMSHSPERPPAKPVAEEQMLPSTTRPTFPRKQHTGGDNAARRPALSRLVTPACPNLASTPTSSPARQVNATPPNTWEAGSVSPTSRPTSSVGTASSRLQQPRPSLDGERQKMTRLRTRDRGASFVERGLSPDLSQPAGRSAGELLGPRTAKVFAAAGLLDVDKEGSNGKLTPSRLGTMRSSIDRDLRSRYTPSKLALSEVGSNSSWGRRRSGSLTQVAESASVLSGPFTESVSTPRTTFSNTSTAPTSISASSSTMQSELQLLQERHSLETGTLLSALADSQWTTRLLREENGQLRDRLVYLEERLANAVEEIRRLQYTTPHYSLPAKTTHQCYADSTSTSCPSGRGQARLHLFRQPKYEVSFEQPSSSPEPANTTPGTPSDVRMFTDTRHKRMSSSSSLFPGPPSNMSLIMHEDDLTDHSAGFSHHSVSPSSPTLVLAKLSGGKQSHGPKHVRSASLSSGANISPTTANFSVVTDSPGSLYLRPEHEKLLGDMPSLNLCAQEADASEEDGES